MARNSVYFKNETNIIMSMKEAVATIDETCDSRDLDDNDITALTAAIDSYGEACREEWTRVVSDLAGDERDIASLLDAVHAISEDCDSLSKALTGAAIYNRAMDDSRCRQDMGLFGPYASSDELDMRCDPDDRADKRSLWSYIRHLAERTASNDAKAFELNRLIYAKAFD